MNQHSLTSKSSTDLRTASHIPRLCSHLLVCVGIVLAATFFCQTAAAAIDPLDMAHPEADVCIVGLPEQVYSGGQSFFIVVLENDAFFDECLNEDSAVSVDLEIDNGIFTNIEGSAFATNTSVGSNKLSLYRDYIGPGNATLAVVRFFPTGAGDVVKISATGRIKDKNKLLLTDRYVSTDADNGTSEIIDYSNLYDVSTLSELALKRKAFYNNSIQMLGVLAEDISIDSDVNLAWFGAIMWTGSLSCTMLTFPTTPEDLAETFDGYLDIETYSFGLDTVFMSLERIIDKMWTAVQYTSVPDAQDELRDMETALLHESEWWLERDDEELIRIFGSHPGSYSDDFDWYRGEALILGDAYSELSSIQTSAKTEIDSGSGDEYDLYAYHVTDTIMKFIVNDLEYLGEAGNLPVDSDGNGLFDFEDAAEPIPSLTNLEPSVEMEVGETRDLVFTLTNAGNDSDVGYLDLSVSSGIEIVANSSDAADMLTYTLAPGKDAFFSDDELHPLTYTLFGAHKQYVRGESATVTVTIRANVAGGQWLKYRLSMLNSSGVHIRIPNAGVKDQQGWYAHETTVTVIDPANVAPAADAGCDQEVSEGTAATLNGSGSSDTDGEVARYVWREGGSVIGSGCVIGRTFSAGTHPVVLTVTDDGGKSDSDTVTVTVTANSAPVADAGCDQSVASGAVVTLDGSGSSDSDGTIEYYEWQEGGVFLGSGVTLETVFAPGVHEIMLYVVDDGGKVGSDEVEVEVAGGVPAEEWNVTFEGNDWYWAYSVQQTTDGGYVLAGSMFDSSDDVGRDVWLVKTDSNGNEQWNKTFGGTENDDAYSVQQTTDGGYVLAGTMMGGGAWLIKTNSNGDEVWNKTFGGYAYSVQQTTDGGYVLAGVYNTDFWLMKTDLDGNEVWNRTFDRADSSDMARDVQQTVDGGYILAGGIIYSSDGEDGAWLVKTDSNGNEQWNRTFGGTWYDYATSVQQTTDGGYIFAGGVFDGYVGLLDVWLVKTDSNGNEQWNKTFGGIYNDCATSVQQTEDGGYVIAGVTCWDAWLVKTDFNGNEQWNKTFSGIDNEDEARSVQQTADGGYIIAGTSYITDLDEVVVAWLIKLIPEGNLDDTTEADIYVNETGWWRDNGAFNSSSTPIQAAVDAASGEDMIFVWNGSYNENVNVNKTLTLRGEGADVVTVTAVLSSDYVFNVTAGWVEISGFTVRGAADWWNTYGIYLYNVDHCSISNNICPSNHGGSGIHLDYSNDNSISNNIIPNDIYLDHSNNNIISNNTCSSGRSGSAVQLKDSNHNTISDNTCFLNSCDGIFLENSNQNSILNNNCSNNDNVGIYLVTSNNNYISNNIYTNNKNGGIELWGSNNNSIINNSCSNSLWGIDVTGGSNNNSIFYNTCYLNSCDGIQIGGSNSTVLNNNCYSNNDSGIDSGGLNNTISSNNCSLNGWYGIYINEGYDGSNNKVMGNIMLENGIGIGSYSYSHYTSEIDESNTVNGKPVYYWKDVEGGGRIPDGAGQVILIGCKNVTIEDQSLNMASIGIFIDSSSNISIKNNICSSNSVAGICFNSDNSSVSHNICLNNWFGIHIHQSNNNSISNNNCSNGCWGLYLESHSNNNSITCNCVQNNTCGVCLCYDGGTNNYISYNNIIENGDYNTGTGGWEWQFVNYQFTSVEAKHNYWGAGMNTSTIIDASIYDDEEYEDMGRVDFYPFETEPITCATDTTPPTLEITSPAPNTTTHSPTITIAGTASDTSGIASVTVNGEPANGTLDWSANVTLTVGENTITVIATDREGLTTTAAVTVRYELLRGDLNRDGHLTSADATIALRMAVRGEYADAADVSRDGRVTSLDALMLLQAAAGSIEL